MTCRAAALPLLLATALLISGPSLRGAAAEEAFAAKQSGDYPRAIALYRELLRAEPADPELAFQLGTVLGWAGRYDEALATLERALSLTPHHADLRLARGRVLAWSGRLVEAEDAFRGMLADEPANLEARNMLGRVLLWRRQYDAAERVFDDLLAVAPANTDALVGRGDVERFQERNDLARDYYERARAADPASADIAARIAGVRHAGRWRLDCGYEVSTFSDSNRADWTGWDGSLRYAIDRKTGVTLGVERAERFGFTDRQFSLGFDRRLNDALSGYARVSATPAADFYARRMLAAGGAWRLRAGTRAWPATVLSADYRAADYGPGTAHSLWTGLTQSTNHRFAVTPQLLLSRNLNGRWTRGWQLRLDGEPNDRWRWRAGYADTKESLSSTVFDFTRELRTRTAYAGIGREFSPAFGVRLDFTREWVAEQSARNALHAGCTTRF